MNQKSKYFLFIWSQVGWFACVFSAKWDLQVASIIFPLVAWIVLDQSKALSRKGELVLLGLALVGVGFDSFLLSFEQIRFEKMISQEAGHNIPLWLVSLWFLFVTTLPGLGNIFSGRLGLAVLVGAVAGPLTYRAGEGFEVLFLNSEWVLFIYSIFWAVFFGMSLILQRKINEN